MQRKNYLWMSVYAMVAVLCVTLVLGLTPIHTFVPVWLTYGWLAWWLAAAVVRRLKPLCWQNIPFLLNHVGLLIALVGAAMGSVCLQHLEMIAKVGQPESCAIDRQGEAHELPFTLELKSFVLEAYPQSYLPKRFASTVHVSPHQGEAVDAIIEVNKPLKVGDWQIYQQGYDETRGGGSEISVFQLVADPWLPVVYGGIALMMAGALCMIVKVQISMKGWRGKVALGLCMTLVLVVALVCLLRSSQPMPALQSAWFVPHVAAYMFAYTLLGIATVVSIVLLVRNKSFAWDELIVCDRLVAVGVSFLTLGMLMGALWAKEAWGHYWTWDPKETWAAVTWFAYLIYLHVRLLHVAHQKRLLIGLIVCFLLLQMCWWGIPYLPVAQGGSMHVY